MGADPSGTAPPFHFTQCECEDGWYCAEILTEGSKHAEAVLDAERDLLTARGALTWPGSAFRLTSDGHGILVAGGSVEPAGIPRLPVDAVGIKVGPQTRPAQLF